MMRQKAVQVIAVFYNSELNNVIITNNKKTEIIMKRTISRIVLAVLLSSAISMAEFLKENEPRNLGGIAGLGIGNGLANA